MQLTSIVVILALTGLASCFPVADKLTSSQEEEITSSGEVSGKYAFVAPSGEEYEFKYNADEEGYRVESDALPEAPEDTDAVKEAKEEFFAAYEKALELAGSYEYEYDEYSDESSEESDEDDKEEEETKTYRMDPMALLAASMETETEFSEWSGMEEQKEEEQQQPAPKP